ncbi:ABC transporter related protein [Geobacter metallireducens RCH3]|uniref:ABC transporter, ATPase protein n=1 Tax=Geobacter metallireducens (strain ATCC 53774 / DSM 7210 / GS-15) TaxID=269799 RepID=Q39WY5_GEOMG|nr:ABC transporter, ATPase protein [Geobacter metallireducens GS-15]EHP84019.1 ABC transporter related protein [Geobacter metallireducens RCH3]
MEFGNRTKTQAPPPQNVSAKPLRAKLLQLTNVSKTFQSVTQAVEALAPSNLEIEEGEFVVFFGPSGCGKSTLLDIIAGFETPTTGEVLFEGSPVTMPGSDRLMMFQEHTLFPWLNVVRNVMYGLKHKREFRFRLRKQRETARSWLKMIGLEEFETSLVHELSGGMKQRVALARALAPDPKVLLVDEPFPALDALVRTKLYADLQDILVRTGKTIISVTHDPREAACLADRVLVFTPRPGRVQKEIRVNLPRPRDINDQEVGEYASRIMEELENPPDEK